MKIVLDESVSYGLVEILLRDGHQIVAIANSAASGNADEEVFTRACDSESVLITRDYHLTNPRRYPSEKTGGIIFIRHGRLVTLCKDSVRIR